MILKKHQFDATLARLTDQNKNKYYSASTFNLVTDLFKRTRYGQHAPVCQRQALAMSSIAVHKSKQNRTNRLEGRKTDIKKTSIHAFR